MRGDDQDDRARPGEQAQEHGTPNAPSSAATWKTLALVPAPAGAIPSSSCRSSGSQAVTP